MKEVLKVEGMSCNHCVNSIETNVGAIEGVSSVTVNLAKGEVTVELAEAATLDVVKETIEDQGYDLV